MHVPMTSLLGDPPSLSLGRTCFRFDFCLFRFWIRHVFLFCFAVGTFSLNYNYRCQLCEKRVPRACALLVDDRPENVRAVERVGYTGILVDEQTGITPRIVHEIMSRLKLCAKA